MRNALRVAMYFWLTSLVSSVAADDAIGKLPKEIVTSPNSSSVDVKLVCIYEGNIYSVGAKINHSYTLPHAYNGVLAQEVLECKEPSKDQSKGSAYWRTYLISCTDPIGKKSVSCS